ncbi:MAG: hypothetical protein CVU11_09165 [Bacteroidetes bacterium HGW-Bacteroidetes-6]|nr:MAG: hypothetical protein CVU11_09165 [Bacteroidetes bacterium HGW-Bacteroidetes-6]
MFATIAFTIFVFFKELSVLRRKIIHIAISLVIAVALLWLIYYKVSERLGMFDFRIVVSLLFNSSMKVFIAILFLFLMPLNWALEAWKWKLASSTVERIGFSKAYIAVLAGITAGFFLPNRVGEFAGKALIFPLRLFWKGTVVAMFTSLAQLFVTIGLGFVALWHFAPIASAYFQIGAQRLFLVLALVGFSALLLVYFNIQSIAIIFRKLPRLHRVMSTLTAISFSLKTKILVVSIFRYFVFTIQNILLLIMVEVELPVIDMFFLISLMFFILAAIPTIFITELPTRGSVMVFLFLMYFDVGGIVVPFAVEMKLLLAASIVWLVNIIVPSVPGIFFLTRMSVFRKEDS